MTTKTFFVALVVCFAQPLLFVALLGHAPLRAAQNGLVPPDVNELCANWREWTQKLDALPPTKFVYEMAMDSYGPLGVDKAAIESWESLPMYAARVSEQYAQSDLELKVPRFCVSVSVGDEKFLLVKEDKRSKWRISSAGSRDGSGPQRGCFRNLIRIPGGFEKSNSSAEKIFLIKKISDEPGMRTVDFGIRVPKAEKYDGTEMLIKSFQVVFAADAQWLPVQIDRDVMDGNLNYVWRTTLEDFASYAGVLVPRSIIEPINGKGDFSKPLNWTQIKSIEEVSLAEVKEHCDLRHWQLANMNIGKSYLRWWIIGGLVILSVAAWWWRSSRTT